MDSPSEPVNPYAPARASLNEGPPQKTRRSFADQTSVWLGLVGILATASFITLSLTRGETPSSGTIDAVGGYLVMLAFVAHAVGIGVVFAAPSGSRIRGLLVNGLAATFLLALVILGLTISRFET